MEEELADKVTFELGHRLDPSSLGTTDEIQGTGSIFPKYFIDKKLAQVENG